MDVAIVTGAASALGAALARALIDEGLRVYGLGGDYREMPFNNRDFIPVPLDLSRPDEVTQAAGKILHEEGGIALLVHNA